MTLRKARRYASSEGFETKVVNYLPPVIHRGDHDRPAPRALKQEYRRPGANWRDTRASRSARSEGNETSTSGCPVLALVANRRIAISPLRGH